MRTRSLGLFRSVIAMALIALLIVTLPSSRTTGQQPDRHLSLEQNKEVASQRRIALVIGNGLYRNVIHLKNPPNDATLVATTLKKLGFEVTTGLNQTQIQMKKLIREFGQQIRNSGGVGLFYFAGHG